MLNRGIISLSLKCLTKYINQNRGIEQLQRKRVERLISCQVFDQTLRAKIGKLTAVPSKGHYKYSCFFPNCTFSFLGFLWGLPPDVPGAEFNIITTKVAGISHHVSDNADNLIPRLLQLILEVYIIGGNDNMNSQSQGMSNNFRGGINVGLIAPL
jgi:hypothetical protein